MKTNLQAIIDKAKAKNPNVKIVIAGMQMPPNLGADYASGFQRVFADLAQENNAALIPFLLEGVGGHRDLNQPDLFIRLQPVTKWWRKLSGGRSSRSCEHKP